MLQKVGSFILIVIIPIATIIFIVNFNTDNEQPNDLKQLRPAKHIPSVDHSKFEILKKEFNTPHDMTNACLSCHTEAGKEIHKTAHWNWERLSYTKKRGVSYIGKKNTINNFCIGIGGSQVSCTKCHIGYGYEDKSFDFTDESSIDCVVCHDNSDTYRKASGGAGYPVPGIDLNHVAQNVGLPTRSNCGMCHFLSGGGNNVKHGDLETTLFNTTRDIDVHMGEDAANMQCIACHSAENHQMKGKMYSVSSMDKDRASCEQCHTTTPHKTELINEHTVKVACQTCHIPVYAKDNATKMKWDWSKAGRLDENGEPFHEEDSLGNHTYLSIKGQFEYKRNVEPEYVWFNGTADHYVYGDDVDTTKTVEINTLYGSYNDVKSKIIPVKIHRAKQIYDCTNKIIIQPKLYAEEKGKGAYWKDFDWDLAAKLGMEEVNQEYSGYYCFINTKMYWPLNHMVSEKDKTVSCAECHTRENSRIANLTDFYLPGRDHNKIIDGLGKWVLILSFLGVLAHGGIRIYSAVKK